MRISQHCQAKLLGIHAKREIERVREREREICRCDCKSVAFLHLTAVAPLPSPSPPPPAPHGLNKYCLCHFSQKCVKPLACVWRKTTKADSVARAVEMPLVPFILCCLRNSHWWNCITKELGNCQKENSNLCPKHFERAWKRKNISVAQAAAATAAEVAATVAAAGATRSVPLPRVGQPAGKVSWPMQLFILINRVFCRGSLSLSSSLPLLWLFLFAAKVN